MALYAFLQSSISPEDKLKEAVLSNNITDLKETLQCGIDPNVRLQRQGGNTALHFAASKGFTDAIDILLEAGGDVNVVNDHGNPPLSGAIVMGHKDAVLKLLTVTNSCEIAVISSPLIRQPVSVLYKYAWSQISEEIRILIIKASPVVPMNCFGLEQSPVYSLQLRTFEYWKVLILCGIDMQNKDVKAQLDLQISECESVLNSDQEDLESVERHTEFRDWLKDFVTNPQTLQHHCRLTIRRSFQGNCNVFFGAQSLILPQALRDFICLL